MRYAAKRTYNWSPKIGRVLPISTKRSGSFKLAYRVQFSDVAYYDFLLSTGLTPRKSKTIENLAIPDEYFAHFLRGLFDGDGTTYAYFDPRWNNSFLYYIGFTSASKTFLDYISRQNIKLFGIVGKSIRKTRQAYILGYGKKDSYALYRQMYIDSETFFLPRKRAKLENFIKQNNNDIIYDNARVL